MAAFDGGEHVVPLAFDVGAVGGQLGFKAGFGEHALAGGYFFGYGSPDADEDHAEICNDIHGDRLLADIHSLLRFTPDGQTVTHVRHLTLIEFHCLADLFQSGAEFQTKGRSMRKQIVQIVFSLLAGCAGLGAQTTYTGTFKSHQVTVGSVETDYTTPTATIPIGANGGGASIQAQLTLTFPAVAPPASPGDGYLSLVFQSSFQASIGLSATLTAPDGTFSSEIILVDNDPYQPQACPASVDNTNPAPQGTSNISASGPCTLNWTYMSADSSQFTLQYGGSIWLTRADGTGALFGFSVTTTYALSTGPAPSPIDLAVDHVEVVQVVQHPDNSIPLVANKSTAARVFVTVTGNNSQPLAGVSGVLHGFRNGAELAGSPLTPFNFTMTVPVQYDRGKENDSLNFLLPRDWTAAGSLRLVANVSPPAGVTEQNTANNTYQVPEPITFTALANIPTPINIYYWPICYQPPGAQKTCPTANVSGADSLIPKLYPIPDDGVRYSPIQTPQKTWVAPLLTDEEVQHMFTTLRKAYLMVLGEPPYGNVDQLAAWLPNVAGAEQGGMADPIWFNEGGTSRVTFNRDTSGTKENIGWILAHEIGHNLGLRHTTTADGCGAGDDSPGSDWKLPDATIQEVGMDLVTLTVIPATKKDLMSYCYDPLSNIWISDFHYGQLLDSQVLMRPSGASVAPLASHEKAHKAAARPQDTAAQFLLISGSARADGTAGTLDPAYQLSSSTPGESSDPAGNHCLRFTAAGGASSDFCFTLAFQFPETFAPLDEESFSFKVALPAGTTRIALRHQDQELASLTVSSQAPSLQILTPSAGDQWDSSRTITWSSSDPNGSPLSYLVQYSADGGNSWLPMEVDLQQPQFTFDTSEIQAGSNTYFRVLATNGVTTASAIVGPIGISATPRIDASPSLNFGIVTPGQSADQTLWVRNKGNGTLTVNSLSIDNSVFTLVSPAAPFTISAGGRQPVTVRFTPAAAGGQTGTLTIASDDQTSATTKVALAGGLNVVSPVPAISVTPNSLAFGRVSAGQTKDLSLTVQNTGTAQLIVSSLTIGNGLFSVVSPSSPFNVAASSQQTVTVRFSPNAAGSQSGSLTIASNDPSNPTVGVTLAGQGAVPAPPAATVQFSDSFNRADAGSCSLGQADLGLGGSGAYYYLPVFSGANIASGALQNSGTGNGGVQFTDSPDACNNGERGINIGQNFNIRVDLLVSSDPAGDLSEAGPYIRNRAAAANDGILGGDSAGYWIELVSTGEVKVKDANSGAIVASTAKPATFDNTVFHTLEAAAQGSQMQVALDGQLLAFTQGSASTTTLAIPDTGGSNDGTAGIAFGRENAWPAIGGQSARNLIVTAFRSLAAPPSSVHIAQGGIANAASNQAVIASGSWMVVYGDHLSATTRAWGTADFAGNKLPTSLDGVSVQINGENAAVEFITPSQINVLTPADIQPGQVSVTVTNAQGTSAPATVTLQTFSPGFFMFGPDNGRYPAALNSDGVFLGPSGLFGDAAKTHPAKPGDTILLFGTGFGPTNPPMPADQLFQSAAPLSDPSLLSVQIGGVAAAVQFAGLVGPGLYQLNVVVPDLPDGDQAVSASIGGSTTQSNAFITTQR